MKELHYKNLTLKIFNIIISVISIIIILFSIINNSAFVDVFINTLKIWLYKVVPPIFTFYIVISILLKLNILSKICFIFKPLNILFRFDSYNSFNLFLTSILIGNPAAANIIYTEYTNNKITKNDYIKLIYNSGFITPLFIFSLFPNNTSYSIVLLASHYLSYFFTCMITRKLDKNKFSINIVTNKNENLSSISQIFYKACEICLSIASIMLFANLIISSLSQLGINSIILTPIELSTGIFNIISTNLNEKIILIILSMLISFNGFCIHMQVFSQIKDIKYKTFLIIRIFQSLFSGIITFFILSL